MIPPITGSLVGKTIYVCKHLATGKFVGEWISCPFKSPDKIKVSGEEVDVFGTVLCRSCFEVDMGGTWDDVTKIPYLMVVKWGVLFPSNN